MRWVADLLIVVGVLAVAIGLILRLAPDLLSWFGRLPGDLRFEGERTRVYVPITSMLLLSLGLSVLLTLLVRLRG